MLFFSVVYVSFCILHGSLFVYYMSLFVGLFERYMSLFDATQPFVMRACAFCFRDIRLFSYTTQQGSPCGSLLGDICLFLTYRSHS